MPERESFFTRQEKQPDQFKKESEEEKKVTPKPEKPEISKEISKKPETKIFAEEKKEEKKEEKGLWVARTPDGSEITAHSLPELIEKMKEYREGA